MTRSSSRRRYLVSCEYLVDLVVKDEGEAKGLVLAELKLCKPSSFILRVDSVLVKEVGDGV